MIAWVAAHANQFVYVLLPQYVFLAVVLGLGGYYGPCVYFTGAAVLTVGVIMMK